MSAFNRVCPRCLPLKDKVIGYTDEAGVQIPPLHPRCRCVIDYREVGGGLTGTNTLNEIGFKPKDHTQWSDEIRLTNSGGKGAGYKTNCQRCVVAHEARMRGYDVIARPSWGAGDDLQKVGNWLEVFERDRETYNCVGSTVKEVKEFIADKMKIWGKGSRAFLWFDWEKSIKINNFGHVIVAQLNENNFVQYGDPQKRKIGAVDCLNAAKIGSIVIMRADNLNFTDEVKRCCKNKE